MNQHKFSLERLAFYANGTLVGNEYEQVHRHVSECLVCQHEFAAQQLIVASVCEPGVIRSDPAAALSELSSRISSRSRSRISFVQKIQSVFARTPRPMRYAFAVQLLLLVITTTLFLTNIRDPQPQAHYQTLSNTHLPAGDIRVVFSPDASMHSRDALLEQTGARIVYGPTQRGVYTLEATSPDSAMQRLQQSPLVLFVQPVPSNHSQQP